MVPPPHTDTLDVLLAHSSWIRQLARSLVQDPGRAEDLMQETWVRALQRPPRVDQPVKGWLATVMRRLSRQEYRSDTRRTRREEKAARPEAQVSTAELCERVSTQRELAQAVLEQPEPYRRTLLLRYYEGLAPSEIAERDGVSVSTVKTRLARGLERLRGELDRSFGGRAAWMVLLVPAHESAPTSAGLLSTTATGLLAMNAKILLAVVASVACLSVYLFVDRSERSGGSDVSTGALGSVTDSAELEAASPLATEATREQVSRERTRRGASMTPPTTSSVAVKSSTAFVDGQLVDIRGGPLVGVRVGFEALEGEAVTEAGGRFRIATGGVGSLVVKDAEWATVLAGRTGLTESRSVVIVAAPRIELAGRVVDEAGNPVAEAEVHLTPPRGIRAHLGRVLDRSQTLSFRTKSDAEGNFSFDSAPAVAGAGFMVGATGFETAHMHAPLASQTDHYVVLTRRSETSAGVVGVVLDPAGQGVEGARVSLGMDVRTTDAEGRFRFADDAPSFQDALTGILTVPRQRLIAVAPGYRPAEYVANEDEEGMVSWPVEVHLQFEGLPLALEGVVLDVEGQGVPDVRVWMDDPTFFGGLGNPEHDRFPRVTHVETQLAPTGNSWNYVLTDARGRFRLEGLLDRPYRISALRMDSLERIDRGGIRPGASVTLRFREGATYPVLRGRLVDRQGKGVPNARVRTMCDSFRARVGERILSTRHSQGSSVISDEEGAFVLENVPHNAVYLRIDGEDIVPLEWGRELSNGLVELVGESPQRVEIRVGRRSHFRVVLREGTEADAFRVVDASERDLVISEFLGRGRREGRVFTLVGRETGTLGVSDEASSLVLMRGGEEVGRIAFEPIPGQVVELRP